MSSSDAEVIRYAWFAFAPGDLDEATKTLEPQVRWHGAGDEEDGCHNRHEAIASVRQAVAAAPTALDRRPSPLMSASRRQLSRRAGDDGVLRACAETCRRCAESCRSMAA